MKRFGNLYKQIYSLENLELAHKKAQKGKRKTKEVLEFNINKDLNLIILHETLKSKSYQISKYKIFTLYDPKERIIFKLPYIDRIVQHAILNIIEKIFVSTFTTDTYNCIKNRGIHKAFYKLKNNLKDLENTKYCMKLDIKKFYPSINNQILKQLLKKKFKDNNLLELLDHIIDSTEGQPIGNYISQYFANFYLSYFDHWIKQELKVKYYYRYCDDMVLFSNNKEDLHIILNKIKQYLTNNLKLELKSNYRIFPTILGIDFIGYKFYHTHIKVRKRIKKNFIKMIRTNKNKKSINSYLGWLNHANCINLKRKYLKDYEK